LEVLLIDSGPHRRINGLLSELEEPRSLIEVNCARDHLSQW